jgi:hypothetical protein
LSTHAYHLHSISTPYNKHIVSVLRAYAIWLILQGAKTFLYEAAARLVESRTPRA